MLRFKLDKIFYELWNVKKFNIYYFHIFGCKHFILNDKDTLDKFDAKAYQYTFFRYSINSKTYRVFNKKTLSIQIYMHVVFDASKPPNF